MFENIFNALLDLLPDLELIPNGYSYDLTLNGVNTINNANAITLNVGYTEDNAVVNNPNYNVIAITANNPNVATVVNNGDGTITVTPLTNGQVTITAEFNEDGIEHSPDLFGEAITHVITVEIPKAYDLTPVQGANTITTPNAITLNIGYTIDTNVVDAPNYNILAVAATNPLVATVLNNGDGTITVTPLINGQIDITISIDTAQIEAFDVAGPNIVHNIVVSRQPKTITSTNNHNTHVLNYGAQVSEQALCNALGIQNNEILRINCSGRAFDNTRNNKFITYADMHDTDLSCTRVTTQQCQQLGLQIWNAFNDNIAINTHLAIQISAYNLGTIHLLYHFVHNNVRYTITVHVHVGYGGNIPNHLKRIRIINNHGALQLGQGNVFISGIPDFSVQTPNGYVNYVRDTILAVQNNRVALSNNPPQPIGNGALFDTAAKQPRRV